MSKKFTYLNINDLITRASHKENNTWETCLHFKGHVAWVTTIENKSTFTLGNTKYITSFYFHQNLPSINNWWDEDGKPQYLSNACLDRIFHVIQIYYNQDSLFLNNLTFREKIGDLYA